MEERYPHIRMVIGIAQPLAGAVALILFLGGTVGACQRGGFGGFISFLITLLVAAAGYVATMVSVESLRALMEIEEHSRQLVASSRPSQPSAGGSSGPGA